MRFSGKYIVTKVGSVRSKLYLGEIITFVDGYCSKTGNRYRSADDFMEKYCTTGSRIAPYIPNQKEEMGRLGYGV